MKILVITAVLFTFVSRCSVAPVIVDREEAPVVHTSAELFADDMEKITGKLPLVLSGSSGVWGKAVIAGTIGISPLVDSLASQGRIDVSLVAGVWEAYGIETVKNPCDGIAEALVVYGNDANGTAYGLMELSRRAGVSPWYWWADVTPRRKAFAKIQIKKPVYSSPDVKYRGIFINDEDWGLHPWAASTLDKDVKDIGPRTYEKVFELLLRHKANMLWPAMHVCTHSFFTYPENVLLAQKYGIMVGTSHCEPMLRNNVDEWKEEYGEYNWNTNRERVLSYWQERVNETALGNYCYTLGMRGVHDSSINGYISVDDKVLALNEIISAQRELLKSSGRIVEHTPQVFCPYKETLILYQNGLEIPDDVTLLWVDDNYGYIRQVGNPQEQARSGGAGIYYHFSYWGNPDDYLWLASTPPALTAYELTKAWNQGCRNMWVFNVGDIKPAEYEMQYALDFAWSMDSINLEDADRYALGWSEEIFGKKFAKEIYEIKKEYYRLSSIAKPEHLVNVDFDEEYARVRIEDYGRLERKVERLASQIPEDRKDAFYQLIQYPVAASSSMNRKTIYALNGRTEDAQEAYREIVELTRIYNKEMSGAKWDGMMDYAPRLRPRFLEPEVIMARPPRWSVSLGGDRLVIPAADFSHKTDDLMIIQGLGNEGAVLSHYPFDEAGGRVVYNVPVSKGHNRISLRFLPTFPLYGGESLRMSATLDGIQMLNASIASREYDKVWYENILRNYAEASFDIESESDRQAVLEVDFIDPSLALSAITINR